jgi:hypothetical protein
MILVETVLGMGRGAVKEEQWREWIQLIQCTNFYKCHNVPPPSRQ